LLPLVTNFVTQTPGLRDVAKLMSGMARERRIPELAPQTFKEWFRQHNRTQNEGNGRKTHKPEVILWADTFNNHFHPTTAQAAVEVLEAAGFQVKVPRAHLCCGRPLYDYGFLDAAKSWLQDILHALHEDIEAGTPVVVLEPSCASVFRDELINLFPHDEDAKRLNKQTFLLSEFLEQKAKHFQLPKLKRKALVQGHCHHKSLMKMLDEDAVLKKMGVDCENPDTGCCGMAGAFGFEAGEHYDVAIKCGERVLLPKVREAERTTLLIADGFSCREQISQTTDRHALHLAQIIQMAMRDGEHGTPGDYPEREYIKMPVPVAAKVKTAVVLSATALALGGIAWCALKRRSADRVSSGRNSRQVGKGVRDTRFTLPA
jgi:Fe-S oxidoreductase